MQNKFSLDLVKNESIYEIADQEAQSLCGGAFTLATALSPSGGIQVAGREATIALDDRTQFLSLINTGPNAGDPNDLDHDFALRFIRRGRVVAFGNVVYGRGIFADDLEEARAVGADSIDIVQGEQVSADECECVDIFA